MMNWIQGLCVAAAICASTHTIAGSQNSGEARFEANQIAQFAKQVERYSAQQGAHVFVIGRVGRPENDLPEGIEFTHVALAVYSELTTTEGEKKQGYAIHNLYQLSDDPGTSQLIVDYPTDFFWSVHDLKAAIAIPTQALQQKLLDAFAQGVPAKVHNPRYSVVANPFNNQKQNCTEHTLNVINAALYNTTDMAQLKVNTRAYFEPQTLNVSRFKLALGSFFNDGIDSSDHQGKVKTTTFTSIARYLKNNQLLAHSTVLTPNGPVELKYPL
ncbi:DUF2145 domain-containing protein [Pseudoalteromonas rubra]|uniref:DUF2145 domain-containing protein n=1 Tax=Pseudoalteromonas rubra TaxID=43658 RepID=A0A5S3X269_9GAMM|nr:DUF2145 domain-containing protein [Pseudoalteromonas rubra]TMP38408.1 DUF2145 domain-containing protein [Pseudoalteromonas rubra]